MTVSFKDSFRKRDFLLLTLDALRYDVARDTLATGRAPNLAALLPAGFEQRHSPATFTFPAHQAFFAGFLPTPITPGPHVRPIALRFSGSRSLSSSTLVLDGTSLVSAFSSAGYRTICVGGTNFFNPSFPLGTVLAAPFDEAHWSDEMGVTSPHASRVQFGVAAERVRALPRGRRAFVFVNASATHPPTRMYLRGAREENVATQGAALADIDRHVTTLLDAFRERDGVVGIVCSDHGTCFGDDGYSGHRLAHEAVWRVPYGEFAIEGA